MASLCGAGISSGMSVSVVRCFRRSSSGAGVRHNPAQPAPECRHIPQRAALLPHPQQRLLHRVLAVAFVAKHRVADMVQQLLDFQRFRLKRARIHRRTSFHLFSDI